MFVVAAFTDRIDGELARRRGLITDSARSPTRSPTRRSWAWRSSACPVLGELPWWVTVVLLVREVGITVMRFVVIRHGVMPASRGGKVKTRSRRSRWPCSLPAGGAAPRSGVWSLTTARSPRAVGGAGRDGRDGRRLRRQGPRAAAHQRPVAFWPSGRPAPGASRDPPRPTAVGADEVVALLRERGPDLACAESLTGWGW